MRVKFFAVPALDPGAAESDLNRFLAQCRVLSIDRQLVSDSGGSYWAVSVTYLERSAATSKPGKSRVDYKEVLSPEDFEVYAALRQLRKEVAESDGVPPYAVFNNAQLAEMVQKRMRTTDELGQISGVGPSRIEAHGATFLERLASLQTASSAEAKDDEANGDPPR